MCGLETDTRTPNVSVWAALGLWNPLLGSLRRPPSHEPQVRECVQEDQGLVAADAHPIKRAMDDIAIPQRASLREPVLVLARP